MINRMKKKLLNIATKDDINEQKKLSAQSLVRDNKRYPNC